MIYYVSFEGTMFNWVDIIAGSITSYVAATQGGLTRKKAELYMSYYLIDCILSRYSFPKLGCI